MSRETLEFLNNNTLIGFTDKRGDAWHRDLSLVIGGLDNHYAGAIPEADILSRLFNWTAEERPLYVETSGGLSEVPNRKALVRSDNDVVLGIHTHKYLGHAYGEWLVKNLSKLVGDNALYANAGQLAEGAVAWVQIEMPENVTAPEGIEVRPFILATTSFDGSVATNFKTGFTNVVCDNTFAMFMSEKTEEYRRKHTRNSEFVLADASAAMNTLHLTAEQAVESITRLINVKVTAEEWSMFVQAHAPSDDKSSPRTVALADTKRQALTGLYRTDIRVAPWAGTAWGVVQAVNTYNEHFSIVRNVVREERKMMRAVKGEIGTADTAALVMLGEVLKRDLINA